MTFSYEAMDPAGKVLTGSVEAADTSEAIEVLRRQGLFVTQVDAAAAFVAADPHRPRRRLSKGKRLKNLAMFTRQLSVLVSSGTPLVQALSALERQAREPAWKDVVASVRLKVEEGSTLAQAMEVHPGVFDPVCRSLIAAGESGGGFDTMLDRLAVLIRKQSHVRAAILGAMVYPILLIFIAGGVLAVMMLFVLPRFAGLFATLDAPLPPTTKFLMDLSDGLRSYWWAVLLGGGALAIAARYWAGTPGGKRAVDTAVLKLPVFGKMFRSFAVARIIRVLGVLLQGKVPLLDALGLARQTARNVHFVELVARAEEAVTRGGTVSGAFGETDLVDPSLVEAIRSGEQSGQIGNLLLSVADFLDEDNEVFVKTLTSVIEPLILIALGVVVGFIAISMFLPLFDLTSAAH
jgi:type IV pilus assembly protein PilC